VTNGVSDADSPFTEDGQVVIGFLPGSFAAAGTQTVTVDITPVTTCPSPPGIRFSTNAYDITADAPLVKEANIVMRYSDLEPAPSWVYRADSPDGPWTNIGAGSQAQIWTINAKTNKLGYFAAGYPITKSGGSNQLLPATVALLIVAVLLLSVPLAIVRRRRR
jgi:hypothetical protein